MCLKPTIVSNSFPRPKLQNIHKKLTYKRKRAKRKGSKLVMINSSSHIQPHMYECCMAVSSGLWGWNWVALITVAPEDRHSSCCSYYHQISSPTGSTYGSTLQVWPMGLPTSPKIWECDQHTAFSVCLLYWFWFFQIQPFTTTVIHLSFWFSVEP